MLKYTNEATTSEWMLFQLTSEPWINLYIHLLITHKKFMWTILEPVSSVIQCEKQTILEKRSFFINNCVKGP